MSGTSRGSPGSDDDEDDSDDEGDDEDEPKSMAVTVAPRETRDLSGWLARGWDLHGYGRCRRPAAPEHQPPGFTDQYGSAERRGRDQQPGHPAVGDRGAPSTSCTRVATLASRAPAMAGRNSSGSREVRAIAPVVARAGDEAARPARPRGSPRRGPAHADRDVPEPAQRGDRRPRTSTSRRGIDHTVRAKAARCGISGSTMNAATKNFSASPSLQFGDLVAARNSCSRSLACRTTAVADAGCGGKGWHGSRSRPPSDHGQHERHLGGQPPSRPASRARHARGWPPAPITGRRWLAAMTNGSRTDERGEHSGLIRAASAPASPAKAKVRTPARRRVAFPLRSALRPDEQPDRERDRRRLPRRHAPPPRSVLAARDERGAAPH